MFCFAMLAERNPHNDYLLILLVSPLRKGGYVFEHVPLPRNSICSMRIVILVYFNNKRKCSPQKHVRTNCDDFGETRGKQNTAETQGPWAGPESFCGFLRRVCSTGPGVAERQRLGLRGLHRLLLSVLNAQRAGSIYIYIY